MSLLRPVRRHHNHGRTSFHISIIYRALLRRSLLGIVISLEERLRSFLADPLLLKDLAAIVAH